MPRVNGDANAMAQGQATIRTAVTTWKIYVDWDRNANFDGTYDEIWDDVVSVKSNVRMQGIFLKEGEQIGVVNAETQPIRPARVKAGACLTSKV